MENKITIYRGSHQIGGCATEICAQGNRIVIDFGANLRMWTQRDPLRMGKDIAFKMPP